MKLTIPPLHIDSNEGFVKDQLHRSEFGQQLARLVESTDEPLVISLDAPWGEGKTTFVRMWQGLLNDNQVPNVYIDAFANDYLEDPFITVVSAVNEYVAEKLPKKDRWISNEFKEKSIKIGGKLLSLGTKLGVKAATLGLVSGSDLEDLKAIKDDISGDVSAQAEAFVKSRLEAQGQNQALIDSFKESLGALPSQLSDGGKPLVIIIDELDRCRPTFAVELLEKIKHLFSVPNVVFLLVMNADQLKEAIKSVYGPGISAHTYLQKFINFEAKLPKRKKRSRHGQNDIETYISHLFVQHDFSSAGQEISYLRWFKQLADQFDLSLREIEKGMSLYALFVATSSTDSKPPYPLVAALAVIKVKLPEVFQKLAGQLINYEELIKESDLPSISDLDENQDHDMIDLLTAFRAVLLSNEEIEADPDAGRLRKYASWVSRNHHYNRDAILSLTLRLNSFTAL